VIPSSLGGGATLEGTAEEKAMTKQPVQAGSIRGRDLDDVTRRHEEARELAAKAVASRNREAHEAALKARKHRDALREDMYRDLSF
jgi:hypothetical protein